MTIATGGENAYDDRDGGAIDQIQIRRGLDILDRQLVGADDFRSH